MKIKTIFTFGLVLMLGNTGRADVGEFQITFNVMDEFGKPMPNVRLGAAFLQSKVLAPATANDLSEKQIDVLTDTNGQAIIKSSSAYDRRVSYGFDPVPGYYNAIGGKYTFQDVKSGKWRPWNPTIEVKFRQMINPIPMYAKRVETHIKEPSKRFGYDLVVGDWVAPEGKGQTTDVFFDVSGYWKTNNDSNSILTISFPNQGDGIQPFLPIDNSAFKSPREAPEDGYQNDIELHRMRSDKLPPSNWIDDNNNKADYFFRVRTIVDVNGNIKSALYGKIYGGFRFGGAANNCYLQGDYFLNPEPNSRNMEFDPKQNLFKNLPFTESISAP